MSRDTHTQTWGLQVPAEQRAHGPKDLECYSCHTSWTTSCGGCHLPIQANWKTERHKYEGGFTRNFATYNPQVARDDMFLLGNRFCTLDEPFAAGIQFKFTMFNDSAGALGANPGVIFRYLTGETATPQEIHGL